MSKPKIAVLTDSSAYIPEAAQTGLNISVIPLGLIWDNEQLRDGVDITPQQFYQRLKQSQTLPTSSQPSAKEFEQAFKEAGAEADAVVGVLLSSKISGTIASAKIAQAELSAMNIHVVDSYSSSMGLGFVTLAAARSAAAGGSAREAVAAAESRREKVRLLFAVDTLEYLHKGGRISGGKRLLGTALKIKPILHFKDGLIQPLAQARTKRKALAKLLDLAEEQLAGKPMAEAVVIDIECPDDGDAFAKTVQQRFGVANVLRTEVSPVVGTHIGPGGIGLAFYG